METEIISAKNILKLHSLRHTTCREEILNLFLNRSHALMHADIEQNIDKAFDRVTVYRTLKTFTDKGIIHKVLDDSGNIKYAIEKDDFNQSHKHQSHIHFKCNVCGLTNCLENSEIPAFKLPEGYQIKEADLLVQGVCKLCNKTVF